MGFPLAYKFVPRESSKKGYLCWFAQTAVAWESYGEKEGERMEASRPPDAPQATRQVVAEQELSLLSHTSPNCPGPFTFQCKCSAGCLGSRL